MHQQITRFWAMKDKVSQPSGGGVGGGVKEANVITLLKQMLQRLDDKSNKSTQSPCFLF